MPILDLWLIHLRTIAAVNQSPLVINLGVPDALNAMIKHISPDINKEGERRNKIQFQISHQDEQLIKVFITMAMTAKAEATTRPSQQHLRSRMT